MKAAFALLGLLTLAACHGPPVLAKPPTLADVPAGGPTCTPAFDPLHPLVAEWPGTSLSDLDVTSKGGVVVVSYDACSSKMKVLSQCRAAGNYKWVDSVPHPDTFTMRTGSDIDASLPFGAVSVKAKLQSGRKLDFKYTSYGQRITDDAPALLSGDCAGATHYVRALTIGSYQLSSSADVLAEGNVQVGNKGVNGSHAEDVKIEKSGGDGCEGASAEDKPNRCAVLQLGLVSLGVDDSGKVSSAGFGKDLGQVTAIPRVSTLSERPIALTGALQDPDYITLLERLQTAKRADGQSNVSPATRADAWDAVAKSQGKNPFAAQAAARSAEWRKVASAEAKRNAQLVNACAERARDQKNLDRLLRLDDNVATKAQKAGFQKEFDEAYAPFKAECVAREQAAAGEEARRAKAEADRIANAPFVCIDDNKYQMKEGSELPANFCYAVSETVISGKTSRLTPTEICRSLPSMGVHAPCTPTFRAFCWHMDYDLSRGHSFGETCFSVESACIASRKQYNPSDMTKVGARNVRVTDCRELTSAVSRYEN